MKIAAGPPATPAARGHGAAARPVGRAGAVFRQRPGDTAGGPGSRGHHGSPRDPSPCPSSSGCSSALAPSDALASAAPPPRGWLGGGSWGTAGLRGSARTAEAPPGWARQRETPDTKLGDPRSPAAPEPSAASPGWSSRAPRTGLISARLRARSLRRRLPVFPFVHTTIDSGF